MLGATFLRLLSITALSVTSLVQFSQAVPKTVGRHVRPCAPVTTRYSGAYFELQESTDTGANDPNRRFFIMSQNNPADVVFHATFRKDNSGNIDLWNEWRGVNSILANYIYKITLISGKQKRILTYHLNDFDSCDVNSGVQIDDKTTIKVELFQL